MKFQKHTTLEQSLRLKELGMPQLRTYKLSPKKKETRVVDDMPEGTNYYEKWARGWEFCTVRYCDDCSGPITSDPDWIVRAFTRQELEDFLMERYVVRLITTEAGGELMPVADGILTLISKSNRARVWWDAFGGILDPFSVLFRAVVWTLEQQKTPPSLS